MSLADSMARPGALFSDSLFNLADKALNFASVFLSSAIGLQVGAAGKFAGLLLDCAFDFVELACCLIVCARFHFSPLLGGCFRFVEVRERLLRFDCLRPGGPLWEVSLPDIEPCIDQYRMMRFRMLVEIAHPDVRRRVAGSRVGRGNICLKRTGLWHRGAADLIEARIPVTNVMSQSPSQVRVLAPRVFHLNRHATASRIFDLKCHSIQQALAAKVFDLDHHTI